MSKCLIDVMKFFKPEQTDSKCHEISRLIALQGYAGGCLQPYCQKLLAVLNVCVRGLTDHHARRFKTLSGNADNSPTFQQGARMCSQFNLFLADFLKTVELSLEHDLSQTS